MYVRPPKAGERWYNKANPFTGVKVMSVHVFGGPIVRIRYYNPDWKSIGEDAYWTTEDLTPDEFHARFQRDRKYVWGVYR